jgi:hypothetical protein
MSDMKKFIAGLVIVISLVSGSAYAQQGQGGGMDPAQRKARTVQMLKDSLQLSDDKANKVADIQEEFGPKRREIMMDQSADRDAKMAKMKELQDEMGKKVKTVLTADEYTKYEALQKNMMMRGGGRGQGGGGRRPGGGQGGGGN